MHSNPTCYGPSLAGAGMTVLVADPVDIPQPAPDVVPMPPSPHPVPPPPEQPPEIVEPPDPGQHVPVSDPMVPMGSGAAQRLH